MLVLLAVMNIPIEKWKEEEASNTHIKIDVSIYKGGSLAQKEINIILKFLFFFLYFPQQYRNRKPIVSKVTLCLE